LSSGRPTPSLPLPIWHPSAANWNILSARNPNNMIVKFFHRGDATSDSAMSYLLSEAPLKYLTGSRNRQGVVRNPAPAVVMGSPELT
jgi:hypothetical protein